MKLDNVSQSDGPVNWNNLENKTTEEQYNWALKQAMAAAHQEKVFREKLKPFEKHIITAYKGNFKVPVTHKIKCGFHWWGIPEGTPNADKLWAPLEFYAKRANHAEKLNGKYRRLAAKLKKVARTEKFNELKYKVPAQTIPSAEVPRRIYYTDDKYFNNPYWNREDVVSRYAGQVGHFPGYTHAERNLLVELDQTLTRNGLSGLEKMYSSTAKKGKWTDNRFVVFGAGGKVIWKHIGSNTVYINGAKISMSNIVGTSQFALDMQQKILGPLKGAA